MDGDDAAVVSSRHRDALWRNDTARANINVSGMSA
jgi:hypothetical protein